jgi:predicted CoA-binding protein
VTDIATAAQRFLAHERIAVTGVSRTPAGHGSNTVYVRLRERGYRVAAVNPNAEEVEGDPAYPDLASIPGGVGAVVIATAPEAATSTVRECIDLGIEDVWMHRAFGAGSVSPEAAELGREHGLRVIEGGCPLMFEPCDDGGHRLMRHVLTWTGAVPRRVPVA